MWHSGEKNDEEWQTSVSQTTEKISTVVKKHKLATN